MAQTVACSFYADGRRKLHRFSGLDSGDPNGLRAIDLQAMEPRLEALESFDRRTDSLLDQAATKMSAVQGRAEAKDYLDIARLLEEGIGLGQALGAATGVYGPSFNPVLSLKSLSFFGDGDLPSLPARTCDRLLLAVGAVDLACLLVLLPPSTMRTLKEVAKRLFWWKSAEEALAEPHRFLAQVMVYGTVEDILAAREHFPESECRAALADPPTGLFDPRSWAYWHLVFHMEKPAEPPSRAAMLERLPDRPNWKHAG